MSSDRSPASTASASEILRPARHSIRNSNRALGFRAARMRASTSWASRYPGAARRFSRRRRAAAWNAGPLGGGSARRLWPAGLPKWDFPLKKWTGQFLRVIVPIWGEVYKFKGWAQLWGCRQNGTFCPILSHSTEKSDRLASPSVNASFNGASPFQAGKRP